MVTVKRTMVAVWMVVLLSASGCGLGQGARFDTLAKDAEKRLQQLNKSDTHSKSSYGSVRHEVQGNTGTLSFTNNLEIDATSVGQGIMRPSIEWRAKYDFKDGKWQYVSSERQVQKTTGQVVWETPRPEGEGNAEVLSILKSLN